MSSDSTTIGTFMEERVSLKRRNIYFLRFGFLLSALIALNSLLDLPSHHAMAILLRGLFTATILFVLMFWTEGKRVEDRRWILLAMAVTGGALFLLMAVWYR